MKPASLCLITSSTILSAVLAADKPIAFKEVPPIVQQTMLKEAAGATIKNTLIEVEHGRRYYECETIVNGKTRDFLVDPEGNVTEGEDEMKLDEVPLAIRATVQKLATGGGKITKLESVKRDGEVVRYEATVVSKDGKKMGLEMNSMAHSRSKVGRVFYVRIRTQATSRPMKRLRMQATS
ncbi:MAG: hypothetical protein JOZ36_00355 [Acidobacteria bacterium]|nr:hypothetical protein [Acidobacteriota bacterium]